MRHSVRPVRPWIKGMDGITGGLDLGNFGL